MNRQPITHDTSGAGDAVVLLNGGAMTMAAWAPIATPIATRFQVLRCDFRGQLFSPGPAHTSLKQHADDVVALLDTLGVGAAHLIGTSFGGMVGMVLAAEHPSRVRSLVAGTTSAVFSEEEWRAGLPVLEACHAAAEGRGDGGRVTDLLAPATFSGAYLQANATLFAERRARVAALPPQYFAGLLGILELLHGLDLRPVLPKITAPTLVIGAGCDRTFPVARSHDIAQGIAGARLAILEGAAHGVFLESPERVLPLLLEFLGA